MGRQTPAERPVGEELPFHFDIYSGETLRAKLIVGEKRKPAESESPVQFVQGRRTKSLVDGGAETQGLLDPVLGSQFRVDHVDHVIAGSGNCRRRLAVRIEILPPIGTDTRDHRQSIHDRDDPFSEETPSELLAPGKGTTGEPAGRE